jgi:hypothetical protein
MISQTELWVMKWIYFTPHHTRAALLLPDHYPVRELVVNEAIEDIRPDLGLQSTISQVQDNLRLESFLADLVR